MSTQLQSAEAILRNLPRLKAEALRRSRRKIDTFFRDSGPLCRADYPKHVEFFGAGAEYDERNILGGNRCGKTTDIAYELTLHMTGEYPHWWTGRRFNRPTHWWAAGRTGETTRDIIQQELFGDPKMESALGTGMIPGDSISTITRNSQPNGSIDRAYIKHKRGGYSTIGLKSYKEGRDSFPGTKKDGIWLDEEPPNPVVDECRMRLMATRPGDRNGMLLTSLTPLDGLTEFIERLVNEPNTIHRRTYFYTWDDDAPHLSEAAKLAMLATMPEYQKDARTKGVPSIGQGQIYPYREDDYVISDIEIPSHWTRAYGLDPGWNVTAAIWGAHDRDTDVLYVTSEYYGEKKEIPLHVARIQASGSWIPGAADPAGANMDDGERIIELYRKAGLKLTAADKTVFAGIEDVRNRFVTGRIKIFASLTRLRRDLKLYRYENGKIIKAPPSGETGGDPTHGPDALRYLVRTGLGVATVGPNSLRLVKKPNYRPKFSSTEGASRSFMG